MKHMEKSTDEVNDSTHQMKESADRVGDKTDTMAQKTDQMAQKTDQLSKKTGEMAATTDHMAATTDHMAATTDHMAATTDEMAARTKAMEDETRELKTVSQQMGQTTSDLSRKTDELKRETDHLYKDMRQADALRIRTEALAAMEKTNDPVAKLAEASHFFMAFEFQLWKSTDGDGAPELDVLRRDAVDDFMRIVRRYLPAKRSLSPANNGNDWGNLYALVVALHTVNSNAQPAVAAGLGGMLQILADGLKANAVVARGEKAVSQLPEYQQRVLEFQRDIIYLLNLRVSALGGAVIQTLASADGHRLGLLSLAKMRLFKWHANTGAHNIAELDRLGWLLDQANATRALLVSLGQPVQYDGNFKHVLNKMVIKDENLKAAGEPGVHAQAVATLKLKLNKFVEQVNGH